MSKSGKLQQQRHSLYNDQGECLAENTTAVGEQIQRITGMDFGRFKQAMMLAQGQFASFLQANGSERAPLLEQITGTEIYTDISKRVFFRSKQEAQKLAEIDEKLAEKTLLPQEEEENLSLRLEALKKEGEALCHKENELRAYMERHKQAQDLAREEETLLKDNERFLEEQNAFAPKKARLEKARRARTLEGELKTASALRDEQAKDAAERLKYLSECPKLYESRMEAEHALAAAKQNLEAQRKATDELLKKCDRTRAIDEEIAAKQRDIDALCLEAENKKTTLSHKARERDEQQRICEKEEHTIQRLEQERESRTADAALLEVLGALRERLALLKEREAEYAQTLNALEEKKNAQLSLFAEIADKKRTALLLDEKIAQKEHTLRAIAEAKKELLGGKDMAFHRAWKEELFSKLTHINTAKEYARRILALREKEKALFTEEGELSLALEGERQKHSLGRATLAAMREAISLRAAIKNYEEERKKLQEGKQCPLCGSLHHPFAQGLPPAKQGDEEKAAHLEKSLEELNAAIAAHARDMEHIKNDRRETAEELHALSSGMKKELEAIFPLHGAFGTAEAEEALQKNIAGALSIAENASALPLLLETMHKGAEGTWNNVSDMLNNVQKKEDEERKTREEKDAQEKSREEIRCAYGEREKELLRIETEANTLEGSKVRLEQSCLEGREALCRDMRTLGADTLGTEEIESALRSLEERRDAYIALGKDLEEARKRRDNAASALAVLKEALAVLASAYDESKKTLEKGQNDCRGLSEKRREILGERDPAQEEKGAMLLLQGMEEEEKRLQKEAESAKNAHAQAESKLAMLEDLIASREKTLLPLEEKLAHSINSTGFAGEDDLRAAMMPSQDLRLLEEKEKALNAKEVELLTRSNNILSRKEKTALPPLSAEDCAAQLKETRKKTEEGLANLGRIREQLRANDEQKHDVQNLTERRKAQADLCSRWKELDSLIGSGDGKKFRNYAQELTFRALLELANRQLAQMTDRYALTHSENEKEALTLKVIDRYQADAVRSARSLSGGESFMVSLALALALAQMAGRNVRVDSVFLDEGFGTLDDDALTTALDMLSSLHEHGKVIGIISHVQAVRDRIPVKIAVEPMGSGKSRLSGPGVSQKEDARP